MRTVFLLGANKSIDRSKQVVEVNEIIQMEGYSYDRYVVYDIVKNDWGLHYKLVNLRTKDYQTADIIRPLKEKFGIGYFKYRESAKGTSASLSGVGYDFLFGAEYYLSDHVGIGANLGYIGGSLPKQDSAEYGDEEHTGIFRLHIDAGVRFHF